MSDLFIVLDVGCLHCGAESRVVSVWPAPEPALRSANRYAQRVNALPLESAQDTSEYFKNELHEIQILTFTGGSDG